MLHPVFPKVLREEMMSRQALNFASDGLLPTTRSGYGGPLAFILPSTTAVLEVASRCRQNGELTIVASSLVPDSLSAAALVKMLSAGESRPLLVIFTDQIMNPADASILVKTNDADAFFSPLEFILNARYGYRLVIWDQFEGTVIESGRSEIAEVLAPLSRYLRACYTLGDDWLVRGEQHLRNPETRRHRALRKLRLFRSAVVNAYRTEPDSVEVAELLQRITRMEQRSQQEIRQQETHT